jgi:ribosomal protein L17
VTLNTHESRAVREYVECIVKLSKEAREAARQQDLSNLTNEELLALATELLANNSKTSTEG